MRSSTQYKQAFYTQDNRAVQKPFWARHAKEQSLKDFRVANTPDYAPLPQFISLEPQVIYNSSPEDLPHEKLSLLSKGRINHRLSNFHNNWLYEEISFSMNKLSLTGLVFGLMVLGVVFFAIGFLSALFTMAPGGVTPSHNGQAPTIWERVNADFRKIEQSQTAQNLENRAGAVAGNEVAHHGGAVGYAASGSVNAGINHAIQDNSEAHYPAYGYPTQSAPATPSGQTYSQPTNQSAYPNNVPAPTYSQPAQASTYPAYTQQPQMSQQNGAASQGYGPQPADYSQNPTYSHPSAESTQWANQSALGY